MAGLSGFRVKLVETASRLGWCSVGYNLLGKEKGKGAVARNGRDGTGGKQKL